MKMIRIRLSSTGGSARGYGGSSRGYRGSHGRPHAVLRPKIDVIGPFACPIFVNEIRHDFAGVVELFEGVLKDRFSPVVVQKGIPRLDSIILLEQAFEKLCHTSVIGKHETAHLVTVGQIGGFSCQRHLDAGGSPGDKGNFDVTLFTDSLQCLVDLSWIDVVSLDNVED